jgi:hypothetical protein
LTHDKGAGIVKADWKRVLAAAEDQGWRTRPTSDGVMLLAPNGTGKVAAVHGTPSDWRALRNTISEMRREGGFKWPPTRDE